MISPNLSETPPPHLARLGAQLADTALLLAVQTPLLWALLATGLPGGPVEIGVFVGGIALYVEIWRRTGTSPGKRLFRLWIVDDATGGRPGGAQGWKRQLGYLLTVLALGLPLLGMFRDPARRPFHDRLAGTRVVRRRSPAPKDFFGIMA
jgi:uncharacterized RDD family membrane protein YckC